MERITNRTNDGMIYICSETGNEGVGYDTTQRRLSEALSRLAAYEDTGLEPAEILPKEYADEIAMKLMRLAGLEKFASYARLCELAEADKDGRIVVLPCKVGDTICRAEIDLMGKFQYFRCPFTIGCMDFWGIKYFLTREAAEKALEAQK